MSDTVSQALVQELRELCATRYGYKRGVSVRLPIVISRLEEILTRYLEEHRIPSHVFAAAMNDHSSSAGYFRPEVLGFLQRVEGILAPDQELSPRVGRPGSGQTRKPGSHRADK
jgi:hypothetical protein